MADSCSMSPPLGACNYRSFGAAFPDTFSVLFVVDHRRPFTTRRFDAWIRSLFMRPLSVGRLVSTLIAVLAIAATACDGGDTALKAGPSLEA
jgi:hypothetical protein